MRSSKEGRRMLSCANLGFLYWGNAASFSVPSTLQHGSHCLEPGTRAPLTGECAKQVSLLGPVHCWLKQQQDCIAGKWREERRGHGSRAYVLLPIYWTFPECTMRIYSFSPWPNSVPTQFRLWWGTFFFFGLFLGCTCIIWRFPARGRIGAVMASLHHSHSNSRSKATLGP